MHKSKGIAVEEARRSILENCHAKSFNSIKLNAFLLSGTTSNGSGGGKRQYEDTKKTSGSSSKKSSKLFMTTKSYIDRETASFAPCPLSIFTRKWYHILCSSSLQFLYYAALCALNAIYSTLCTFRKEESLKNFVIV